MLTATKLKNLKPNEKLYAVTDAAGLSIEISTKGDGIETARKILPRCWFDAERCKALRNYHREFNEKLNTFNNIPVHDWSSHAADTFRYLSLALPEGNQRLRGMAN
jgi:hypothetical protein